MASDLLKIKAADQIRDIQPTNYYSLSYERLEHWIADDIRKRAENGFDSALFSVEFLSRFYLDKDLKKLLDVLNEKGYAYAIAGDLMVVSWSAT